MVSKTASPMPWYPPDVDTTSGEEISVTANPPPTRPRQTTKAADDWRVLFF